MLAAGAALARAGTGAGSQLPACALCLSPPACHRSLHGGCFSLHGAARCIMGCAQGVGEARSALSKYTYDFLRAVHENNLKTDTLRITYNMPGTLKSRY